MSVASSDTITLAHGGGGELMKQLLAAEIFPKLDNEYLRVQADSATLPAPGGKICLTTDSFVVTPLEFPGGDIGHLAVCGTVNDLAVAGAKPLALTCGLILEEGLPLETLRRVMDSLAKTAADAGVPVVTGDTKVVQRRNEAEAGLMINTAGVGVLRDNAQLDPGQITPGDVILISGTLAEHGLAVMSAREGLSFQTELLTDAACLHTLIAPLFEDDAVAASLKFLRDPTRGGLAGVLADLCEETHLGIELQEAALPVTAVAQSTADLLGLDVLTVANEGKVVAVVAADQAQRALAILRRHPLGKNAVAVGTFLPAEQSDPPLVELVTRIGGRRIVTRPYGEQLPRIC